MAAAWDKTQAQKIQHLENMKNNFDLQVAEEHSLAKNEFYSEVKNRTEQIASHAQKSIEQVTLMGKCEACGHLSKKLESEISAIAKKAEMDINRELNKKFPEPSKSKDNIYIQQLEEAKAEVNNFFAMCEKTEEELKSVLSLSHAKSAEVKKIEFSVEALERLVSLCDSLKTQLITSSIKTVEFETNSILESYFASEIRIELTPMEKSRVEVSAQVSGNKCSYQRLSKGQMSLLKFCFAMAVMKVVQNNYATSFNAVFLDEPLDGCDADLKIAAFNYFASINKENVLVIDHNEMLQNQFERRYLVKLESNVSTLQEK
jgi:hypothetical protein